MSETITRETTFEFEARDILTYLDAQLELGRARILGIRSRSGLPCYEVEIPENRRVPVPARADDLLPCWAEVPCHLRPQWCPRDIIVLRSPSDGWTATLAEVLAANSGDGLSKDELRNLFGLAVGESCNLGGGASGITTVERVS